MTSISVGERLGLDVEDEREIRSHLEDLYAGVFTPEAIVAHQDEWVGRSAAEWALNVVKPLISDGGRILDVGCGYGSFVLLARQAGYDAYGFDLSKFEVSIAQKRAGRLFPTLDAQSVFRTMDATRFHGHGNGYDAITLWNVLEHVPNHRRLLRDCAALLNPGGRIFLVCPNYFAFRMEAHYHVPWSPWLWFSRKWAREHLIAHSKDPRFFEESIYYTTNWSVLFCLWRLKLHVFNIDRTLPLLPPVLKTSHVREHFRIVCQHLNPLSPSTVLMVEKPKE